MVEFDLKINAQGTTYLPKEIRNTFGSRLKLIPNFNCCLFYSDGRRLSDVLVSAKRLVEEIEARVNEERR